MNGQLWAEKAFLDFGITPILFPLVPGNYDQDRYIYLASHNPNEGLADAAERGIGPLMYYFINKGARDYNSALISAARGGYLDIVKAMVSLGARDYNNAIVAAARNGHTAIVEYISEININNNNYNPIMIAAAEGGYTNIVKFTLNKGAKDSNTAMIVAASKGHVGVVELLIERGVSPYFILDQPELYPPIVVNVVRHAAQKVYGGKRKRNEDMAESSKYARY